MEKQPLTPRAVFDRALELESGVERKAYLDVACAEAPEIRRNVEALLQAYADAGGFLEPPNADLLATAEDRITERAGTVIGPYKLLEQIGEGGFGVVFMAEQTQPVRRKVALKVLKPGMDTRQVVGRFEAERQALALMDHPNIAHVFDGGQTATGRPYFVMELVRGIPITEFCDQNQLPVRQRLELFITVCQAVQHAHLKGIIHRDLKPTNVLVTLHDPGAPGMAKVIDFGIAKATGQQLTEKTLFTNFAQMIGTPLYMSPEQAQMSGQDIDTRTDIYALGVLLYELLTGTTPFDQERLQTVSFDEIRRIIREEEPAKPSTRISTLGSAAATVSARRGSDPKRLSQLFRGELDWIVMKAVEKDRNRRYETASAFTADVQRYLHDEPVLACPPSAWYRVRKIARRNRAALATTAAVLTTIIVGLAASTFLIAQERDAARDAAQREGEERERAETNLRRAREAVDRVFTLAAEKMADEPHMEQIRRALLQDALEFYQGFLKQKGTDPLIRHETARAYLRVGRIQILLGRFQQTEDPLRQAVALLQRLTADYPSVPEYRSDLADAQDHLGMLFGNNRLRRPQDCLENASAALAIRRNLAADFPNRPEFRKAFARQLTSVAIHYSQDVQDNRKSEEHFRECLEVWQELQKESPNDPDVAGRKAWTHWWLGELYQNTNRLQEAEAELRRGLALREKLLAARPNSLELLTFQAQNKANLARLLVRTGRPVEAERLLREAIAIRERMIANYSNYYEQWQRLFYEQNDLGDCLLAMGRPLEAEEAIRKCVATSHNLAAAFPGAPDKSTCLGRGHYALGLLLQDTDRPQEAAEAFREAKKYFEEAADKFPDARPRWAPVHNLAWFLADCPATQFRDPARAAKLGNHALQFAPQSGHYWLVLGLAQYRTGQAKVSLESLQKSMAFLAGGDSRHWFILAMAQGQLGNKAEARKWYDQAVKWMEKNQPKDGQLRRYRAEAAELLGVKEKK